jgi:hypothetical protein
MTTPAPAPAPAPYWKVRCYAALGALFGAAMLVFMVTTMISHWGLRIPLDPFPWPFIPPFVLMLSLLWSGLSLLRADSERAQFVLLLSAMFGVPLALFWAMVMLSD